MTSNPRFFILGYFGWYNVGDDAIGLSVIKELKNRYPDAKLLVTCHDRYFLENFHGTNISQDLEIIGFNILKILRGIFKSRRLIITGGTHFHDEDGLFFTRLKILLSFILITTYARILHKPPLLLGHGIGPLYSSWSKALVKVILLNSKKIFVRDEDSFRLVTMLGFGDKCIQGFDCAILLIKEGSVLKEISDFHYNKKIIGISLLPVYGIYSNDLEKDIQIVKSFAKCLGTMLKKDNSINLRLFAFRAGTRHSDVPLLISLMNNINAHSDSIELVQYEGNIEKFLKSINGCDLSIGMRYHASVFAYFLHKPQIILDYMGKCKSLGRDIGINEMAIVPVSNILTPSFCSKIQSFISNPVHNMANLPIHSAKMRAVMMFDNLEEQL